MMVAKIALGCRWAALIDAANAAVWLAGALHGAILRWWFHDPL
jgi:hypothetical protein